eukprot:gene6711-13602_t
MIGTIPSELRKLKKLKFLDMLNSKLTPSPISSSQSQSDGNSLANTLSSLGSLRLQNNYAQDNIMCELAAAIKVTEQSWKCINGHPVNNPCGNSTASTWYAPCKPKTTTKG